MKILRKSASIISYKNKWTRNFYDSRTKHQTIFAPATQIPTSSKCSPLAIVRVSGPRTKSVIETLTNLCPINHKGATGRYKTLLPRQATLTKFYECKNSNSVIDIGMIIWFPSPNSYTGEDVCELHLHGSSAIMRNIIHRLGKLEGLRPAEAGEFTRRALENKKMNLIQAESLIDLISSRTDNQRKLALNGLEGSVIKRYDNWVQDLTSILAHLEASIDFGEDELLGEQKVVDDCKAKLDTLSYEIIQFISAQSKSRHFIQNGFKIVIMGSPNVGKSSLMNKLCQMEKSIVSDICGTTRDPIEQSFELGGHSLNICDTAGLREITEDSSSTNHDIIEREGIRRALLAASKADIILYVTDVIDISQSSHRIKIIDDISHLLSELVTNRVSASKKLLYLIVNKTDLKNGFHDYQESFHEVNSMVQDKIPSNIEFMTDSISCRTEENLSKFTDNLIGKLDFLVNMVDESTGQIQELPEFANARHISLLTSCHRHLEKASHMNITNIDLMAQHVREATDYLSRCTGAITNDQILDIIFKDFCIGK